MQDTEVTGDVPAEWLYEPSWQTRPVPTTRDLGEARWVGLADAELGAEFGRVLASRATVLRLGENIEDVVCSADYVLYAPPVTGAHVDDAAAYRLFNGGQNGSSHSWLTPAPGAPTRLRDRYPQCSACQRRRSREPAGTCRPVGTGAHAGA